MVEINVFDMPENNKLDMLRKIEALAMRIREDWSDPRSECRKIKELCEALIILEGGKLPLA